MIDLEVLKSKGITHDSLKKKLEDAHLPPGAVANEKDAHYKTWLLVKRMSARVQGALDFNSTHYSLFYALDLAFDAPFRQVTPTLLSSVADKSADDKDVQDQLKSWGVDINDVISEQADPVTPGKNIRKVSLPAFFQIFVPLVASYLKIRWAKLLNDRKMVPLFSFVPSVSNELGRMRCEAITSRVEVMGSQYGHFETFRQWIFNMLHYGQSVMFPVEEWHQECQLLPKGNKHYKGEKVEGDDKHVKVVIREGIRYHLPHPTRYYFDRAWPASSMNTDTGCSFAGYWRTMKWGDIKNNKAWWNLDKVAVGKSGEWGTKYSAYFKNVFRGCVVNFPSSRGGSAQSRNDTENAIANSYYSDGDLDSTVLVTEHFEKLIPKDYGLGDYEYPVWFRFVLAGDCTVLYAAPMAYCPTLFIGYDHVENRTHNASMSMEILPFQDQFGNLLTQTLLAVRQNLANVTWMDTDIINEDEIKKVENLGERLLRKINFLRFSGKKLRVAQQRKEDAIFSHKFSQQDIPSLMAAMKTILDTLERVLVMSSQEVGQAASHEQTAEEVKKIDNNTSTRVTFTGTSIDVGRDYWKKQLYMGLMAYGQDEFYAQVPMETLMDAKTLSALGFTYATDNPEDSYDKKTRKAHVKANKTAIAYESFASDRDGEDRPNSTEMAKNMIEFVKYFVSDPEVKGAIGIEQLIAMANYIGRMAGFPRDFKLQVANPNAIPPQDMVEQVTQMVQELEQRLTQDVQGALKEVIDTNNAQEESIGDLGQRVAELQGIVTGGGPQPPAPEQFDNQMPSIMPMEQSPQNLAGVI
jgi:hypothetical protein